MRCQHLGTHMMVCQALERLPKQLGMMLWKACFLTQINCPQDCLLKPSQ